MGRGMGSGQVGESGLSGPLEKIRFGKPHG